VADGSTFAPGLALLPVKIRADVECLYRVLRTLDDLVDEDDPRATRRVRAVERWARAGQMHSARSEPRTPQTPETRALERLARSHLLPRHALLQFCAGMRHDIARAHIDGEEDFTRYCQQVGGAVGIVLARLLGGVEDDAQTVGRLETSMATLGRAMQVTNIARDIDEDLSHGRLYIPRSLIERFGPPTPGAREPLVRELIARADQLYEQGLSAIPLLREGGRAMALSAALYREILRQLEREGFGRRAGRAVVPAWRRRALIAQYGSSARDFGLGRESGGWRG